MIRLVKAGAALALIAACGNNNTMINDMTTSRPTLTLPSSCTPATVPLSSFYSTLIGPKCATTGCHDGTTPPKFTPDLTAFRDGTVGVTAGRLMEPGLDYIAPSDGDASFVLYKITNQQSKIQFGGASMPSGQPLLSAADQCTLINWVRSGAN